MAKGSLSPRQKMINLMYLVFIAMLALNMSKEVLSAFGLLNERLTESNTATVARNSAFMESLSVKASDNPDRYADVNDKAKQINKLSSEFSNYLEGIKTEMMKTVPADDQQNYEVQDKADFLDQSFFQGDKLSPQGKEFVQNINDYRSGMLAIINGDYPDISTDIEKKFSTAEVTRNQDGKKVDWLKYHFEGFPLIASRTKITQMQADVNTIENDILSVMLEGEQASALKMSNYNTFMDVSKTAFYSGENFDGSILLGRTDSETKPKRAELTLDGRALEEGKDYTFEGGRVKLNVNAGNPGDHKIEGTLFYGEDGAETPVPVSTGFATINKPNSATISADKMNVVYRGVVNPMTIAFDGARNVTANAPGLSKVSGSAYAMSPGTGREVTINVTATLPDGETTRDQKVFRIKDIPRPTGTIRGEDGDGGPVRMQREGLEISSVGAALPDFDFDLKLNVTGFSFKVSGQPTVRVNGRALNDQAKAALRRAKRGETVQIFDINASITGNSGYKLKKITPVFIELTN
jgi:gliding motility-associated protein GldM